MDSKQRTVLELDIEKAVSGGAGLARSQGQVVFVDAALPGSRVLAEITKEKSGILWAVVKEVIRQSPDAAEPACPHFGQCGGCTWQHARYEAQLEYKRDIVAEQMARLGGLETSPEPTLASPLTLGYRNKMEFAFGPGARLGLRMRAHPARILEVDACLLMPAPAMDILAAVREFAVHSGLAAYNPKTGAGVWRYLVLRHSPSTGRWLAQLILGPKAQARRLEPLGRALLEAFPQLSGLVLGVRQDRSDYALAERRIALQGQGELEQRLGPDVFTVSAEAFFQTNTQAAEMLAQAAVQAANAQPGQTIWDLYCGVGSLSLPLARTGAQVLGFEENAQAVRDAVANAAANSLHTCTFAKADVLNALKSDRPTPHAIVLDPPRAGLHPEAPALLLARRPGRIVYVSCNPATLARDLARLAPGYALQKLTPVDMFPHTPHVECVAELASRQ